MDQNHSTWIPVIAIALLALPAAAADEAVPATFESGLDRKV
jgi:hypothetical protein